MSEAFISNFENGNLRKIGNARQGLITGDNNRFLRLWHEISIRDAQLKTDKEWHYDSDKKWYGYNKGGVFRRWYGNNEYVVNWKDDGKEIKCFVDDQGKLRSRPQNTDYYFKQGITWSDITSGTFSARAVGTGFVHDSSGPKYFLINVQNSDFVLALLNSKCAQMYLDILAPTYHFREGPVSSLPLPLHMPQNISNYVVQVIEMAKADWDSFETSWDFASHPLVRNVPTVADAYTAWQCECNAC